MSVRTRFAPSPTGYMHIGNLRTALYGYLFAKKEKGQFVLRIEDTDQERYVEDAVDIIYSTLKETGLAHDEGPDIDGGYGPYVQSERKSIYPDYAKQLVDSGHAYYCFCSNETLEQKRAEEEAKGGTFKYDKTCLKLTKEEIQAKLDAGEEYVIRLNTPLSGSVSFTDSIFGTITVDCSTLDDMILLKSDGMPTYNFANVVDDHLMAITHVMRGSEYLSSTPKYNLLYNAFGWEPPIYVHLPLIMKDVHNKLSKRNGDASYQDLIAKGYLSDAIINYIALLGWNSGTNQEIYSHEELIEAFSLEGISKSPAIFDPNKLAWMNGEYIKALSVEKFNELAMPWYERAGAGHLDCMQLSQLLHTRVSIFSEIPEKIDFLLNFPEFSSDLYYNKKLKCDAESAKAVLPTVLAELKALETWTVDAIHELLMSIPPKLEVKNGVVLWPARIALSGMESTPGGAIEIAYLIGKDETIRRLEKSISALG